MSKVHSDVKRPNPVRTNRHRLVRVYREQTIEIPGLGLFPGQVHEDKTVYIRSNGVLIKIDKFIQRNREAIERNREIKSTKPAVITPLQEQGSGQDQDVRDGGPSAGRTEAGSPGTGGEGPSSSGGDQQQATHREDPEGSNERGSQPQRSE